MNNQKGFVFVVIALIAAIVFVGIVSYTMFRAPASWPKPSPPDIKCNSFGVINCPKDCVVCPPCEICSSISCQTEEFCAAIGIDRDWYKEVGVYDFESCAAAGNPVMESYPRQCRTPKGKIFVEEK